MKKVFVSGCYDIVHAGHIQFFEEARALGDYLIVSFASEPVLWHHKQRKPSIPDEHKKVLLESLRMVDKVILGTGMKKGLERLAAANVKNVSLTNFDVIAQVAAEQKYIKPEDVARLLQFRNDPSDESWIGGTN